MLLKQLFDQDSCTYTYLVADLESREAIIIDPVIERVDRDLRLIAELGLELVYTLDTHVHADHVTGSGELRRRTGALSGLSAVAQVACVDRELEHGDVLRFGRYALEVRSTPGHTNGCLTFVLEARGQTVAFTGDALFIRGCGRTDFQQGSASTLYRSVHEQIYSLPQDTVIYPGHDYRGHTASTVAEEKAHNPRFNATTDEDDFIALMDGLDLAYPKRIHEALPANMSCGQRPMDDSSASDDVVIQQVSAENFTQASSSLLVDVRSHEEFEGELGHLAGAILTPLPRLRKQAEAWDRDAPIVLVCRTGNRSMHGCSILSEMGFTDVTNLSGGMVAWHAVQEVTP